ncbi:MAG TPA: AAA family ATPase [Acidimicrobiales bacterium]|nr:AAA family ATPase [Acidimicrobiales bacterium]
MSELPFVGREAPLAALVSAVQAGELGERVAALVAGEPGIGKSRLVREMAARVSSQVLWAGCWEGDGAPPYWVWRQLLRPLDGEGVLSGAGAGEGEGRFGLFDAVTEVFATASQERPLVLVIEDLHWADEASVRLLQFLSHDRRPRRVAVVGTYRDTDLDPGHPFARSVGELVRDGLHLVLGGLGKRDVGALLAAMGSDDASVASLHRRSGGNPFFLRELVRLTREAPASAVPAGVRPVVSRRVGNLTPATQEVLAAAAVAGVEFDLPLLGAAIGSAPAPLLAALDEARAAGLVDEAGGRHRFVHTLVRESLYDGLGLATRSSLHRRLAEVLDERFGDARLPEIASHALHGAVAGGDDRALDWAVRAAERSFEQLAYEEAAAWYGRALGALWTGQLGDARRGELLTRQGEAHLAAGDIPAARTAYQEAAVIARRRGDAELLARAALGLGAGFGGFEVRLLDPVQVELLEEALQALDPRPSMLRAWVLARLSVALSFMDAEPRRRALSEDAVAMARELEDPAVLGYALAGHCDVMPGPDDCELRLAESTEVVRLARAAGDRPLELLGRRLRVEALLEMGEIGEVDAEIERFAQVADQIRQPLYRWYVPLWRGMRELMRREIGAAARHCEIAEEIGALAHSENARFLTFTQWWVRQCYEGRYAEAGRAMAALVEPEHGAPGTTAAGWPYPAVVAAQLGEHERARGLLEQWMAAGLERRIRDSEWLPETAQLAEVAVLTGCRSAAGLLYDQLRPYAHRFTVEGIGAAFTGSVAWRLALVARFLGRHEEAAAYEGQAREANRRAGLVGDPPPLAGPESAPAPAVAPAGAAMAFEGATWAVTFAGTTCRVRDGKGVRDLAVLLARPGEDVHCLELVGGTDVGGAAGPVIDQQARRSYERRIRELQSEVDDARAANDPGRADRSEDELDALVQQLAEAFGLSGRSRASGSAAERARSAAGWRIRAALRQVVDAHPVLGRHLQNAVRTGTWCSYRPETAITWTIDAQGRRA